MHEITKFLPFIVLPLAVETPTCEGGHVNRLNLDGWVGL